MDNQLLELRKELHSCPELGMHEMHTSNLIAEFISQFDSFEIHKNVGGTGVLAIQDSNKEGPVVVLRAELDALPIEEVNTFEYKSKHTGISHKCGHDGHMTILCGIAKYYDENPIQKGQLVLLFQPAEENGLGAEAMMSAPKFRGLDPNYIFALHNLPAYPKHEIILRDHAFTASVKSIVVGLTGKTSHAAEPENGYNPALAISEIIQKSLERANNQLDHPNFSVVTPIHINMGEKAYGVSAGRGEVHLTIRTWTEDEMIKLEDDIVEIVKSSAAKHNLSSQYSWTQIFKANHNDKGLVKIVENAAHAENLDSLHRDYPFKWGEDFGLYTQRYKACIFGLGAGEDTPALHNPDYDFPDEITDTGIRMFRQIISQIGM